MTKKNAFTPLEINLSLQNSVKSLTGFTLIELLVAVTIIGILMALILPAIAKTKEKAYEATCVNNLKQLYMAVMMYADDHDGKLPETEYVNCSPGKSLRENLTAYIPDNNENYTCPTNPFKDIYLDSQVWGHSCYGSLCECYNKGWDRDGEGESARKWDSSVGYVTNGNALIADFVEDEIGLGRVGPSHRNKFGLVVTVKGVIYFWYVVTAGQSGPWAEYPSGKDCILR